MTVMQLTVTIAALVIALPSCANALISLYDRFLAQPGAEPMAPISGKGNWTLRIYNVIGIALLAAVIIGTWVSPPNVPVPWASKAVTACDDQQPRVFYSYDTGHNLFTPQYTLIRPVINPGKTAINDAQLNIEKVEGYSDGGWHQKNDEQYTLQWAGQSKDNTKLERLATSHNFALVRIDRTTLKASIPDAPSYTNWNGEFAPGRYRIYLVLTGANVSLYRFTLSFGWFGGPDGIRTFTLDGGC